MANPRTLSGLVVHLSDDDIMAMVGPANWGKGLTDFRSGHVLEVRAEDDRRAVGRVRGPGVTYRTWIEAVEGRLDLTCACTVGRGCRHSVAALLQLREDVRRATPQDGEWRSALFDLVGETGMGGEPMALLVDTHDPSQPLWMSPLRPGTHARWVTKRASWLDLTNPQWASVTEELNPTHLALLREGYRYSREGPQWRSPNEVSLESLGERAGTWLRRLDRAGVSLFADTDPLVPLSLDARPWTLALDARSTQEGLLVGVAATDGTTTLATPRLNAPTRLLLLEGGTRIAELRGGENLLENLPTGGLHVPAADLAEFQTRWLPRLRRTAEFVSTDGSYTPEEVSPPQIVATVRLEGSEAMVVRWWVEYTIGSTTSRLPLEQADADPVAQDLRHAIESRAAGLHLSEELWRASLRTLRLPAWRAPEFLERVVAALDVEGLVWDVSEDVSEVQVDPDAVLIDTSLGSEGSTDWFDLRARVLVNGREVELKELLAALAAGEDHMLVDGVWVTLDGERLEHLRALLSEAEMLGDSQGDSLRLSILQAGLWEELEEVSDHVEASQEWVSRVRALSGEGEIFGLEVPPSSTVTLRPYQEVGHRWLTALAGMGLGGILADDMGLG
ncbi:MAG: helicase, partial [Actinomyces sp.]|nr:helicase [Actinomyces sp.]